MSLTIESIKPDTNMYRVSFDKGDHTFLSEREYGILKRLRRDQSLRVLDMGRVLIFWKERKGFTVYEAKREG